MSGMKVWSLVVFSNHSVLHWWSSQSDALLLFSSDELVGCCTASTTGSEMARPNIFQARTAHSPQHPAINRPWTEDIYSFWNRPAHGPLNNCTLYSKISNKNNLIAKAIVIIAAARGTQGDIPPKCLAYLVILCFERRYPNKILLFA